MKKIKVGILILLVSLSLIGCSNEKTDFEEVGVETSDEEVDSNLNKEEYNELVYEDDKIKIIFQSIEEVPEGKYSFNAVDLIFEVENKLEEDIVLQVENLSVNGKMVEPSNVVSSTDINAKKIADAYVSISDEYGYEIPEIKNDIEIKFKLFSWDNDDLRDEIKIEIELD